MIVLSKQLLKNTLSGKEKAKLYDCIDKNGKLYLEINEDEVCMINSDTEAKVISFGALTPELVQNLLRFCGLYTNIKDAN